MPARCLAESHENYKIIFQSVDISLIWKYIEDENGEKDYDKMDVCVLILQTHVIFGGHRRG